MALLLALQLLSCGWRVTLVTLAAPPSAGKRVVECMARSDRLQSFRLVNLMDPVPRSVKLLDSVVTTIGLAKERWLFHLGSPIVLDDCLTQSISMLATVAEATASDDGFIGKVASIGEAAVDQHMMDVYIANLGMYRKEPGVVETVQCVARAIK